MFNTSDPILSARRAILALFVVLPLALPDSIRGQEVSCVADSLTGPDATLQFVNPMTIGDDPTRFSVDLAVATTRPFDLGGLTFVYSYNDEALDFESVSYTAFTTANPCYSTIGANTDNGQTAVGLYIDPRIDGCSPTDGGSGSTLDPIAGPIVVATVAYTVADDMQNGELNFLASETHSDENATCATVDTGEENAPLAVSVEDLGGDEELPDGYRLGHAYPNPFNPATQLSLEVATQQAVVVEVYDMMGRRVAELFNGELSAGSPRQIAWRAEQASSGVYIIRVTGEEFHDARQVTLLK